MVLEFRNQADFYGLPDLGGCCNITDTSVIAVAEQCAGLKSIDLGGCCNITDTSVVALAEHCPGLTKIDLGYCSNITDTSVVALAEHCPELKEINLGGCENITDTSKQLLRDYLFTKELFGLWTRDESDCCVVVDDDMNACKGEIN